MNMVDIKRKVLILIFTSALIICVYQIALKYRLDFRYGFSTDTGYLNFLKNKKDEYHRDHGLGGGDHVVKFEDHSHHSHDNSSLADILKEQVKVLCWVMTSPDNHASKAVHIMATWGKRCNKILFATESNHDSHGLPLLVINTTSGRDHLTAKTMQTFDYLYKTHLDEYDWFLKADDDTYVIVENLRYFLSSQDPSESIYFGHHFNPFMKQGYFSGGAGYTLSRAALKKFGERSKYICSKDSGNEDVEIGMCMQSIGVVTGDSRDALGRSRFHCFNPETHIQGSFPDWYYAYDKYGSKKGIEAMSDYSITFHYIPVDQIYAFEFFLYHLRPYGIISGMQDLNIGPQKPSLDTTTPTAVFPSTLQFANFETTLPSELVVDKGVTNGNGDGERPKKLKRRKRRRSKITGSD